MEAKDHAGGSVGATATGVDVTDEANFDLTAMVNLGLDAGAGMLTALGVSGLVNGGHIVVALVDAHEPGVNVSDRGYVRLGERTVRRVSWAEDYVSVAENLVRLTAAVPDNEDGTALDDHHVSDERAGGLCRRYVVTADDDENEDQELLLIVGVGTANPWLSRAVAGAVADTVGNMWVAQTLALAGTESTYVEPAQAA